MPSPLQVLAAPPARPSRGQAFGALGRSDHQSVQLPEECALAIAYNGLNQAVMMLSPQDLEDFVVGFTLGAGIVDAIDDIYDITLLGAGEALRAEVRIAQAPFWRLKQQRRQLPGNSSCGLCGVEALDQALPQLPILPGAPLPSDAWLRDLRRRIQSLQPVGRQCGALHAAAFMDGAGQLLLGREDIGRHNALDKLIGAMARDAIDGRDGSLVVTSRCSLELIHKALRAGCGTLICFSAPTGLAVSWAQRHRLNLIHLPHHSPARVYSPAPLAS